MKSTSTHKKVNLATSSWPQRLFNWHRLSRSLLPGTCLFCKQPLTCRQDLCPACRRLLPLNNWPCQACAEPLQPETQPPLCRYCRQHQPAFDRVIAPWLYQPPYSQLIWQFKYSRRLVAGYLLLDLLNQSYQQLQQETALNYTALLVIPEQKERTKLRGYHAPSWLAARLSLTSGLAWRPNWLRRIKNLPSQQGLSRKLRWLNPQGALRAAPEVAGGNLLLLDDVVTTGASSHWAAYELKRQGAKQVDILTCAKTPFY